MKKALIYISIILGVILFAIFALVVIMMLAPGIEIFGIKYVSGVVGKHEQTIIQTFTSKDIYINASKVPININFSGSQSPLGVEFVQYYQGFAKAKVVPNVTLTNKDGQTFDPANDSAVYINVTEYQKFIWARENIKFYLNVNLPSEYENYNNIYINSQKSQANFNGGNQTLNNLSFSSNGGLNINNSNLTITNQLTINTHRYVSLGSNVKVNGDVIANLTNESLSITNIVGGDITFNSGSGDLSFAGCDNLNVETSSGSIKKPISGQILGSINVTTTSGNIDLGSVRGNNNKIVSRTGYINIESCLGSLDIQTNRSTVTLGSVNNLKIVTTTGNININKVAGNLNAEASASGDILCGAVTGNAVANTRTGDITFTGAIDGDFTANTKSGNIKFVSCNNLLVVSESGSIFGNTPPVVKGTATIKCNSGEIKLNSIGKDVTVTTSSSAVNIVTIGGNLTLNSNSSQVNVQSVRHAKVSSNYSHIYIGAAIDGVEITSSGNVNVGELGSVGAAKINSGNGDITLKNTTGKVNICANGHIDFTNASSTDIRINRDANIQGVDVFTGRGSINASNLKGDVRVYSESDINLTFAELSGKVRVETKGISRKVTLNMLSTAYNKVTYFLNSTKGQLCAVFADGDLLGDKASSIKNPVLQDTSLYDVFVNTYEAQITLNLGKAA